MCVAASTVPWSLRDWVRDGVIASFTPPATWPDALVKRWTVEIGTGYATPIVVGDRVYQFSRIGENETMTAFDAATGKLLWQGGYPAAFTMLSVTAAARTGPEVDADLLRQPALFDRHDRHRDRVGCGQWHVSLGEGSVGGAGW